jgi:hypothetical protein
MDLFDFRYLTEAVQEMPGQPGLLQKILFRERNPNPAPILQFDVDKYKNKVVPYTSAVRGGTVLEHTRRASKFLQFPKLRPKKRLDPKKIMARPAGHMPYVAGGQSIAQAAERNLAKELQDVRRRLDLTIEKACADVLQGGLHIPEVDLVYDFGMPADHKVVLSGTARWGQTDANPNKDLEAWCRRVKDASGYSPDILILGTQGYENFISDAGVKERLDNRRIDGGLLAPDFAADFKGTYGGLQVYVYGGSFLDAGDQLQEIWPSNKVALISTKARAVIEFGLIEDLDAGLGGVQAEYFAKMWKQEDPSALWLLGETDPLPVPYEPAAYLTAVVC